ncbi:hypothetical protein OIU76_017020, partial [Salix suchowensis]
MAAKVALLFFTFGLAFLAATVAADPDMLQDVCVADFNSGVKVNGFTCRENIMVPKRSRRSSPSLHRRSDCLIKNTYGCPSKGGLITRINKSYNWAQMGFLVIVILVCNASFTGINNRCMIAL